MVVDEVEGRSDYGRDLNVDITIDSEITCGIIGIQVKGGGSFFRHGQWVIPSTPTDWAYWRASTVPIIGMVWNPKDGVIRWRNLTELARSPVVIDDQGYDSTRQSDDQPNIAVTEVLDYETFGEFVKQVESYLRATDTSAYLQLLDRDDEVRRQGIFNCWSLGRRDPRPFILLRHLLPTFDGNSLVEGITVLAHATSHPDIYWRPTNWISPLVKDEVQLSFRWTLDELVNLVDKVENLGDEFPGWERGGVGQSLWAILAIDPALKEKLPRAIRAAVEERKFDAGFRLLVCYQWLSENPLEEVSRVLRTNPELQAHESVNMLIEMLHEHGQVPVY